MLPHTRIGHRLAMAVGAAALALAACDRKPAQVPEPAPVAPVAAPAPPQPPPVLDRTELLRVLENAASAYAAGSLPDAEDLTGRRFIVRQAFGCRGPEDPQREPGLASSSWSEPRDTIEITLKPADWTQAPVAASGQWEAVEGFWINRPWLRTDGCPARAGATTLADAPASATPQTAGLAAVFEHGGSRVLRREGKAFRHTLRGEAPLTAPSGGYRLVLEGRFTAFPGGGAIRCHADAPDQRPVCIAAAEIDRVAFEDAGGAVLSEWRLG